MEVVESRNGVIDALALLSFPLRFYPHKFQPVSFRKLRELLANVLQALLLEREQLSFEFMPEMLLRDFITFSKIFVAVWLRVVLS